MNTFFLVVTFAVVSTLEIDRPLYLFSKPQFDSYVKCYEYVQLYDMNIFRIASSSYNFKFKPEAIYCMNRKAVKEIFEYNVETKKEAI